MACDRTDNNTRIAYQFSKYDNICCKQNCHNIAKHIVHAVCYHKMKYRCDKQKDYIPNYY